MIPAELYVFEYVLGCVSYCVEETVKLKIINFISAHTHIVRSLPFNMELDMEVVSIFPMENVLFCLLLHLH